MRGKSWCAIGVAAAVLAGGAVVAGDVQPGWTLYCPMSSTTTYLIDQDGGVVHTWASAYRPGQALYMLDGGALLRTANDASLPGFGAGGRGGRIQRIAWDGTVEWDFQLGDAVRYQHHDAIPLPNGNVLAVAWDLKTVNEAILAGRNPARLNQGELWSEVIVEIRPTGPTTGEVVWEWRAWDHLVQNFDIGRANYGEPSANIEKINLNYPPTSGAADWLHINGLDYNAARDEIVLSVHNFNEIWVISHAPGASGEILYRWGNSAAYGMAGVGSKRLFGQHNPRWIADGLAGAGRILVYNNGLNRPAGAWSSVEEIQPPLNPDGSYARDSAQPFGPANAVTVCDAADGERFYSQNISGAQRLSNGNTLACIGSEGRFIELDGTCAVVWEYTNAFVSPAVFRAERIESRDPRVAGLLWFRADFNNSGAISVQDIFDFLSAYFGNGPGADFNESGGVSVQDIFDFLGAYFAGE